ncbi:autotransporter outer membrane beta-barrel domain-containing protein [Helicobacter cholecystus]|uniref:Autotransporter outer membrane beta-barrel domain-containing protein n=1 Tax=Helicobacter cholecystus TaxID=45498 RepID=A0A3D8IWB4_9HELI|nr:autotransporter outer membrane beta-barrel domain-containing protein [Helicobacter cholecystus]
MQNPKSYKGSNLKKRLMCLLFFSLFAYGQTHQDTYSIMTTLLRSNYLIFKTHTLTTFSRLGELRDQELDNTVWISENFGFLRLQEGNGNNQNIQSYNNLLLGLDTSIAIRKSRFFVGGYLDIITDDSQSNGVDGSLQSYGLGAYLGYMNAYRFYLNLNMQYYYLASDYRLWGEKVDKMDTHNFYLGVEVGQRFALTYSFDPGYFFWEPSLSMHTGYLPRSTNSFPNGLYGRIAHLVPFALDARVAFGREFNSIYRGDIKGGISLGYDNRLGGDILINDFGELIERNNKSDWRIGLFLESDFILNQYLRFFFRSESTFLGDFNVTYQASLGIRFYFGKIATSSLKVKSNNTYWQNEGLQ